MSENAEARALAIPEIVTLILGQMDMRTLLIAQRTCQKWKDLICNTKSLQENLFLQPIRHDHNPSTRVNNPLLAENFPSIYGSQSWGHDNKEHMFRLTDLPWEKESAVREMFIRPEASWRRMLTHQPPLYRAGTFEFGCGCFGWNWIQEKALVPEDGLRMAPLFEFLIDRDWEDWAFRTLTEIYFPASRAHTPAGEIPNPDENNDWSSVNPAREEMMKQFDIVLEISGTSTCTEQEDWEEEQELERAKAEEEGVELPDTNLTIWKRISECYLKMGLKMSGFQTDAYGSKSGMWD